MNITSVLHKNDIFYLLVKEAVENSQELREKYLTRRREEYQKLQKKLNENPELLAKYLQDNKEKQKRYENKLLNTDPKKLEEINKRKLDNTNKRNSEARKGDTLHGLVFILKAQLANRKSHINKMTNPQTKIEALEEFSNILPNMNSLVTKMKEILGTYIAEEKYYPNIISDTLSIASNILNTLPLEYKQIKSTIENIIVKLRTYI